MSDAVLGGADAVVHADESLASLAGTVEAVGRGEAVLQPAVVRRLAATARAGTGPARGPARPQLTAREVAILRLVDEGRSVKQTALALGVSSKTVENVQGRLFRKLGARNRAHAVTLAHRLGLLEAEVPAPPEARP